jgi:hypothetical protein
VNNPVGLENDISSDDSKVPFFLYLRSSGGRASLLFSGIILVPKSKEDERGQGAIDYAFETAMIWLA